MEWEVGIPGKSGVCLAIYQVACMRLTFTGLVDTLGRRIVQVDDDVPRRQVARE